MPDFVTLHSHSEYSNIRFLDSCIKIKDLVFRAAELGFKGIAVTEHECLSGAVKLMNMKASVQEQYPGFKIIFGNEIYLIDENDIKNTNKYYHFILLAKDEIGWQQLKELSSRAWERGYMERGMMRVPTTYQDIEEVVGGNPGHLIGSTACFTAGHMVQTDQGSIKIENINPGDKVLTHDGTYQTVISPTTRYYVGGGRHIVFNNNKQEITCTDNHKFLVFHHKQKTSYPATYTPELIWKPANLLKKGDKTLDLFPTYQYSLQTSFDITNILANCGKSPFSHLKYKLKRQINITPELMRLYGLWLGDGHVCPETNRVGISFSDKEFPLYKDFVLQGISQLGDFNPHIIFKSDQHKVEMCINSVELTQLIAHISNNGKSDTKFIHPALKHISPELDAELLYGYLLADGYYRRRVMDGKYLHEETVDATVSKQLYDDITELYYSIGFIPSCYTIKAHNNHKTAFYHTSSKSFFGEKNNKKRILSHEHLISFLNQRVEDHLKGRGCVYNGIKYLYKTVKDISAIKLNEQVYCLNVENNHNFICNGIIVHNCLGGELDSSILEHDVTRANNFVKWGISVFGKTNFFLEMQVADTEEQIQCNEVLLKLASHYGLRYTITTDTHYLYKDDFKIHSSFLNSRQSKDRETEKFYKYTYMMSIDEMTEILLRAGLNINQIETGYQNTMFIYDMIEDFDFRLSTIVPHAKIPEFNLKGVFTPYLDQYQYINQFINSEYIDDRYLMYLIEQGLLDKHIELDTEKLSRLDIELSVVSKVSAGLNQTVSSYFLLMREVIDIAWNYSFVGAGRGSSTGFYINYLIDLVQVNPLQYNLPYWRFLNDVRFELPDIDTDLNPAQKENIMMALKEYYGQNNVLNCITFKTESLKAAIVNAMRGLGYSNDEAQTLSSLVPVDRGHVYTIDECINGNETLDLPPSPNVIEKLKEYPHLLETVQKIEGLHTNASIHASAVYIFDNGYIEHNSLMRAPNGTPVTAFDMEDTNALSGLKIDLLYTDAQNKMMKCMDLLLKDGLMEWQGSLRATYNKYLHPDVLNYTNEEMWKKASSGEIANLFQWETAVGAVAIKKAQPRSVLEMATINSAIRVQSEGTVQPIDRYIMFHKNISLWYQEMYDQGLDDFEIEIMREHLLPSYGCSLQQEDFMQLVMDPNIAGFTLKESNTLRKTIAHKVLDQIAKQKELFFTCCERQGTRKEFANYVWTFCIEPLAKYSFSVIHAVVYSIVAVQEMNLAMFFPRLYWQCACLCVNAGNSDTNFDDDEEDVEDFDDEEETISKKYTTANYGKIAKAISNAQVAGVRIALPDINLSQPDFIPDNENNVIRYSLQAVNVVGDELLNKILTNRPYEGLTDFIDKVAPTQVQMIGLIKAGAFDSLYPTKTRTFIMAQYLQLVADREIPLKDKLTSVQLKKALEIGVQFPSFTEAIRMFKFKQYIKKKQFDAAGKRYLLTEAACITFFNSLLKSRLNLSKGEYSLLPDGVIAMKPSAFDKICDEAMKDLLEYLNSEQGRKEYQTALQNQLIDTLKNKYCQGSVSKWEMDTLSCYQHEHELAKVSEPLYHIRDFNTLPERMGSNEIVAIAGTVIDNNKLKHTVSVLTTHGVVDVKIYAGQYVRFNQRITTIDPETGKKTVIEESWFKRGTKLIIYGQRKDNAFVCKNFKEGNYNRLVGLIDEIHLDGTLKIYYNRKGAKKA